MQTALTATSAVTVVSVCAKKEFVVLLTSLNTTLQRVRRQEWKLENTQSVQGLQEFFKNLLKSSVRFNFVDWGLCQTPVLQMWQQSLHICSWLTAFTGLAVCFQKEMDVLGDLGRGRHLSCLRGSHQMVHPEPVSSCPPSECLVCVISPNCCCCCCCRYLNGAKSHKQTSGFCCGSEVKILPLSDIGADTEPLGLIRSLLLSVRHSSCVTGIVHILDCVLCLKAKTQT